MFASILNFTLSLIPSFPFSLIVSNISFNVGYHIDSITYSYIKGEGYGWSNFLNPTKSDSAAFGNMLIPSDLSSLIWLMGQCVAYLLLLWYFDNFKESNSGFKKSLFDIFKRRLKSTDAVGLDEPLLNGRQTTSFALFELRNLDKTYTLNLSGSKVIHALRHLSLNIYRNEVLALLGENGAGKSTLISIIAGNLKADNGEIMYCNRPFGLAPEDRQLVSVCPQYDLLWNELTVYENMKIVGDFRGLKLEDMNAQIEEILDKLDLKEQKNSLVAHLSGGMKRRISIGITLLGDPQLVILDEPTTGLDPIHRKSVWNFIKELKSRGKTVLITTHIMDEADYLSDRIAIINRGKLLRYGTSVSIKAEFKIFNAVFSLKKYDEEMFDKLLALFKAFYGTNFNLKYKSNSLIKFNIPSDDVKETMEFVKVLENLNSYTEYSVLAEFIDTFEISSIDLEEAYMLVNEEKEQAGQTKLQGL